MTDPSTGSSAAEQRLVADAQQKFGSFFRWASFLDDMIKKDKKAAAEVLLESMGGKGWDVGELAAMLDDKDTYFSTKPEGVMQYAEFMHSIGSLKNKAASLDDLFFDAKSLGGGN